MKSCENSPNRPTTSATYCPPIPYDFSSACTLLPGSLAQFFGVLLDFPLNLRRPGLHWEVPLRQGLQLCKLPTAVERIGRLARAIEHHVGYNSLQVPFVIVRHKVVIDAMREYVFREPPRGGAKL